MRTQPVQRRRFAVARQAAYLVNDTDGATINHIVTPVWTVGIALDTGHDQALRLRPAVHGQTVAETVHIRRELH